MGYTEEIYALKKKKQTVFPFIVFLSYICTIIQ